MTAHTDAVEALERLAQQAMDYSAEDAHEAVQEDSDLVRARLDALASLEGDTGTPAPSRCSQCGQPFTARACGPTHAVVAAERRAAVD